MLAPAELSGLRIVVQQLAQARARQARTSFHDGLANKKGPRKRPFGGAGMAILTKIAQTPAVAADASAGATVAACISEALKCACTCQKGCVSLAQPSRYPLRSS